MNLLNCGTQKNKVMEHLLTFKTIDPMTAMMNYKIMRLAAVVFELKADGIPIKTRIVKRVDHDGKVVTRWAEYYLEQ